MVIYSYTLPAILAFLSKIVILVLSLRAERQNFETRLFVFALLSSMAVNVAEILVLQKFLAPDVGVMFHFAAHIILLALLVHLAMSVSLDRLPKTVFFGVGVAIYGSVPVLEGLVIFTSLLISGAEPLGGYTYTRIPGPLYWLYELYVILAMLAITLLPVWGLLRGRDIATRNRCKLWVTLSAPLALLVLVIIGLLHYGIHWFNVTVTTPLLIAMFMAAVGYAVHHQRPIDLNFYIPGSRLKRFKIGLYTKLADYNREISHARNIGQALKQLAVILKCPLALFGLRGIIQQGTTATGYSAFPLSALHDIGRMAIANEIRESDPKLHALMIQHRVAAIVPFFPHSKTARHWLLLGEPFNRFIYTSRDFREIERLFGKIAGLLLDKLLETGEKPPQAQRADASQSKKSLSESVAEFEARLIRQALASCDGNQAHAARLLGVRPNTLHYKIERYRIVAQSTS
jgi:hypothetical protein